LVDTYHDPSNFGLVSGATLQAGEGKILILGNYWPFPPSTNKADLGLWSITAQYLKKARAIDPHDYIKSIINGKAENHNSKSLHNYTIVGGDFNHIWNTRKYQLQQWVEKNNWAAPSITHAKDKQENYSTYFAKNEAKSWIDQLLITPATAASLVLSTTFFKGNLWVDISDHRPIMIGLNLPGVVRGAKATSSKTERSSSSPDIDAKDPATRTAGPQNP